MTAVRPTVARLQWFKKGNSAYRAQNERSSVANSEVPILSTRKVVFVVDDDPSVLKGLERLLRVHGFDVELFDSAESFRDRASVDEAICVFLDINLTGKSGIELRRELTSARAALPVTNLTQPHQRQSAGKAMGKSPDPREPLAYCGFMNWDTAMRFCGSTRMTPPRGLSISAIRKNEIDTTIGKMRSTSALD